MFKYCDALRKVGNLTYINRKLKVVLTICCRPVISFLTDQNPKNEKRIAFLYSGFLKILVNFHET
jgi:hypothetical protein